MKSTFSGKIIITFIFMIIAVFAYGQSSITYDAGSSIDVGAGADICATNIIINGTFSGGGTICTGPLPITMSSFTSSADRNNVRLMWVTETELNNSGFDIERKIIKDGALWQKIAFVQGSGTSSVPKGYNFDDKKLQTGKYQYRLKQIDFNGNYEYFNLESDVTVGKPKEFILSQNYPNPSNPKSNIDYQIQFNGKVSIKIYDITGQEVFTLVNESKEAGYYTAEFDGTNLSSGVYFFRIVFAGEGANFTKTKKMVLVK